MPPLFSLSETLSRTRVVSSSPVSRKPYLAGQRLPWFLDFRLSGLRRFARSSTGVSVAKGVILIASYPQRTLIVCLATVLLVGAASTAGAQRSHIEIRGSGFSLYDGDATVGSVSAFAWTIGVGTRVGPLAAAHLEAFYTLSPMGRPSDPAPRIHLAGVLIGGSRPPQAAWSVVGSFGLGVISVQPRDIGRCDPPLCFNEGGPNYTRATLPTAIGRLGLDVRIASAVHARFDGRLHQPIGADENAGSTGDRRFELGLSLLYMF